MLLNCRKCGDTMRKNLKSLNFILMFLLVLLTTKHIVTMSTNIVSTLCELAIFTWAIIGCIRADEKNNGRKNE